MVYMNLLLYGYMLVDTEKSCFFIDSIYWRGYL